MNATSTTCPTTCPHCGEEIKPARRQAIIRLRLEPQCLSCAEQRVKHVREGVTADPEEMRSWGQEMFHHD